MPERSHFPRPVWNKGLISISGVALFRYTLLRLIARVGRYFNPPKDRSGEVNGQPSKLLATTLLGRTSHSK